MSQNKPRQLLLLPEFRKFISASASGRRLMPTGKKVRAGTLTQYRIVLKLLEDFEQTLNEPLRLQMVNRASLLMLRKEMNYWSRFFKNFSRFLYTNQDCYDQYAGSVFKIIKTFFNYLLIEKGLPIGEFHKKFRIPSETINPVILSPEQLKFLITDHEFETTLAPALKRVKDIFVVGCTVALRYQDLMRLQRSNLQDVNTGVSIVLHTQKTGAEVKIPLPDYVQAILKKYGKRTGRYLLPRLSGTNLNLGIKRLMEKAGWTYPLPKFRQRRGEPVEIKNPQGGTYRFSDHITAHTMRRTAITTLLLLGVEENAVRKISGHAPGSKEFYKYVVVVQHYLDTMVKSAHYKLLNLEDQAGQKVA